MEHCDEILKCTQSQFKTNTSHYLVIVLKCGTVPIIDTTLWSCSHSCQLFKLRHIIAVASIRDYC